MRSKEVTIWYRRTKGGEWEHNHIEDGWKFGSSPTPVDESQANAWKNAEWKRSWGYNIDGKVHEIVRTREE